MKPWNLEACMPRGEFKIMKSPITSTKFVLLGSSKSFLFSVSYTDSIFKLSMECVNASFNLQG